MTFSLLATTHVFACVAGEGLASPFTNGSFEAPGGAAQYFTNGDTSVTGWTHFGVSQTREFSADGSPLGITAGERTHYVGWGASGVPMQSDLVEALDSNALIQSQGVWSNGLTLAFVATSTATMLRFTDQTTAEGAPLVNWGFDNVTVDAVPEPSTFVFLGAGLVLVGVCRKQFGQGVAQ